MRSTPILTLLAAWALTACFSRAAAPEGMSRIPGGTYEPLYKSSSESADVTVEAFWIDQRPVTNGAFLDFVTVNPQWQRSRVKSIFADAAYLRHWASDLDIGPNAELLRGLPVANVSWFAARAYADWIGKRLPTTAEWERVALASETKADARDEPGYAQRILEWYGRPTQPPQRWQVDRFRNVYGVYAMHGLLWEWVEDFNTALVTGESRGDAQLERTLFCGSGSVGASNFRDYAAFMRFGFRSSLSAQYAVPNLGFRCAQDAELDTPSVILNPIQP